VTTAAKHLERAEECVRLANLARDSRVQAELLMLRQAYLRSAAELRKIELQERPEQ
jgi:hypothetical protein